MSSGTAWAKTTAANICKTCGGSGRVHIGAGVHDTCPECDKPGTPETSKGAGYHLKVIPKGELGEISKIIEEVLELEDARDQNAKIMILAELADIYGAIRAYLHKHHAGTTMGDLEKMADLTERAFKSGRRK